jgi:hypothetical protein
MTLRQFVEDVLNQKSSEIDELKEFQKILDENQTKKEEIYMISFAPTE